MDIITRREAAEGSTYSPGPIRGLFSGGSRGGSTHDPDGDVQGFFVFFRRREAEVIQTDRGKIFVLVISYFSDIGKTQGKKTKKGDGGNKRLI